MCSAIPAGGHEKESATREVSIYIFNTLNKKIKLISSVMQSFSSYVIFFSLKLVYTRRLRRLKQRCALSSKCIQKKNKNQIRYVALFGSSPLLQQIYLFNKYSSDGQCWPEMLSLVKLCITNISFLQLAHCVTEKKKCVNRHAQSGQGRRKDVPKFAESAWKRGAYSVG